MNRRKRSLTVAPDSFGGRYVAATYRLPQVAWYRTRPKGRQPGRNGLLVWIEYG